MNNKGKEWDNQKSLPVISLAEWGVGFQGAGYLLLMTLIFKFYNIRIWEFLTFQQQFIS